jgi:hypothetical protein
MDIILLFKIDAYDTKKKNIFLQMSYIFKHYITK